MAAPAEGSLGTVVYVAGVSGRKQTSDLFRSETQTLELPVEEKAEQIEELYLEQVSVFLELGFRISDLSEQGLAEEAESVVE